MRRAGNPSLALPLGGSLLLHVAMAAFLVFYRGGESAVQLQTVSVRLVAAPAGPRNIGEVKETPRKEESKPAPKAAPQREQQKLVKAPSKAVTTKVDPTKSTVVTADRSAKISSDPKDEVKAAKTPPVAEKAGGGEQGSKGTDVTTATFVGLQFPDEGYLKSIINKIMFRFKGPYDNNYVADFEFVIDRDGCIQQDLKTLRSSPSSEFNANAETAILMAGAKCGFSKLPAAWKDDILRIHFRFDPKVIRGK